MASWSRRIPSKEWEDQKSRISKLYLDEELRLEDVRSRMQVDHGFEASISQYEYRLRHWGMRKNIKSHEWEQHLSKSHDTEIRPTSEAVTVVESLPPRRPDSIKRARRYIASQASSASSQGRDLRRHRAISKEKMARLPLQPIQEISFQDAQDTAEGFETTSMPLLDKAISSPPQCENAVIASASLDFDLQNGDALLASPHLSSTMADFLTGHMTVEGSNLSSSTQLSHGDTLMQSHPEMTNVGIQDLQHENDSTLNTQLDENMLPSPVFSLSQLSDANMSLDCPDVFFSVSGPFDIPTAPNGFSHNSNCTASFDSLGLDVWNRNGISFVSDYTELLVSVPFRTLDVHLHFGGIYVTNREIGLRALTQKRLGTLFTSRIRPSLLLPSEVQTILRRFDNMLPGGKGAVITSDQSFETNFARFLLYSMLNGFAGLDDAPMENILKFIRSTVVNSLLLQILEQGPRHVSKTLSDNIFRAAIEAGDDQVAKLLLDRLLVDVNAVVCIFRDRRYTALERAAAVRAYRLIRVLIHFGADVNMTREEDRGGQGGALRCLIISPDPWITGQLGLHRQSRFDTETPPEYLKAVDLLVDAGVKVSWSTFEASLHAFDDFGLPRRLCRLEAPSEHQTFFSREVDGHGRRPGASPLSFIARFSDDYSAEEITAAIVNACEKAKCGKCLFYRQAAVEAALVEGAKRGLLKFVKFLDSRTRGIHLRRTSKVFCAALRSENAGLIDYILSQKPELNPAAISNNHIDFQNKTTPIAEAVRTGYDDLINQLEAAGAISNLLQGGRFEALIVATAEAGNIPYMEKLLVRAVTSKEHYRPSALALSRAIEAGHYQTAWRLLEAGATVNGSPLSAALLKRQHSMARFILNSGVSGIIHPACELEVIRWGDLSIILDLSLSSPDLFLKDSLEALCEHCIRTDHFPFFRRFAESSQLDPGDFTICLNAAIRAEDTEAIESLLEMGANPFDKATLKASLTHHQKLLPILFSKGNLRQIPPSRVGASVLKGLITDTPENMEALEYLLSHQAVNLVRLERPGDFMNPEPITTLGLAIEGYEDHAGPHMWAVKRLLQAGSDPNRVARLEGSTGGETAFMIALKTGDDGVVQLLLDYGADINKKPLFSVRQTPLQYAAKLGSYEMVSVLLKNGADVNGEPAMRGGTALQFAAISGNCNIVAELLRHGADLGTRPSKVDGRWPLEGAAEHGRLDMIKFLWDVNVMAASRGVKNEGFDEKQCLRAMNFASSNGHLGCRDLISELSGVSVDRLQTDEYGAPWIAY